VHVFNELRVGLINKVKQPVFGYIVSIALFCLVDPLKGFVIPERLLTSVFKPSNTSFKLRNSKEPRWQICNLYDIHLWNKKVCSEAIFSESLACSKFIKALQHYKSVRDGWSMPICCLQ